MIIENNSTTEKFSMLKAWKMTNKELMDHFQQSESGYSNEQLTELTRKYPKNELEETQKETILEKILEQFQDPLVKILLGAAVISFIIALTGDIEEGITAYVEPFVILLILIANATIGVVQDLNADKALENLKKLQTAKCQVKRNNQICEIDSTELIPGDIVYLNEGEKAPADIRILEILTSNFEVNESNFTGESRAAYKICEAINEDQKPILKDLKNIIFSTTGITTGQAIGIVIGTAMSTEIGEIQKSVKESQDREEKSPLEKKLDEFGDILTKIIGGICIVVWLMNYKNFFDESHGSVISGMIYYFKISVALAVAAIPEGLPAVITTCFALGSIRMSANNAIVRKLHAIETLGCTSVICSDKTGTLTTNNMSVIKVMLLDSPGESSISIKEISGTSFKPEGRMLNLSTAEYSESFHLQMSTLISSLCNLSAINIIDGIYTIKGSPTEGALKVFAEKMGQYDQNFNLSISDPLNPMAYNRFLGSNFQHIYTLEFDRDRKAMSVLLLDVKKNKLILLTKGAPEILLKQCSGYFTKNGQIEKLTHGVTDAILANLKSHFLDHALRTIAFCYSDDLPSLQGIDYHDKNALKAFFKDRNKIKELEQDLTFASIVGMYDPPRKEVANAINTCFEAGIRVIMITGDNKDTADAIGTQIGIIDNRELLKTSSYTTSSFFQLSEIDQKNILAQTDNMIFSRSEPRHKMLLVRILKELGYVVAMTGDGVNDAPALAEANIGVAMGLTGTEVAKEASHLVLADDNFATIVKAIEEGRSIYMNMKAFIRYLISSNIGEVVSIFLSSMFGLPEAFTSIQLLWVNLVTDGPPATALGFNPPENFIMKKPPRHNSDPLLTKWVILRYFVIGTYVGAATIGIFVYWYLFFEHADGHSLITWDQLTTWIGCEKWTNFKVNSYGDIDLSNNPCNYFTTGKAKPVTLSLTVLVVIEMLNSLNAISDESSLLQMPPTKNLWLLLAITFSMTLHCIILYIPFLNKIFGIVPLDLKEWILVLIFSFPVILIDEVIKLYVRITTTSKTKKKVE